MKRDELVCVDKECRRGVGRQRVVKRVRGGKWGPIRAKAQKRLSE